MKNFYEMLELMEGGGGASVARFPQDFEQVLNLMVGGPWSFVTNQWSPFYSMDIEKASRRAVFYVRAEYRGMSESGRHYRVAVRLVSIPDPPINRDGADRFGKWKREFVSYDPNGSPMVYFDLEEIAELGPDTDGSGRATGAQDDRSAWERAEEEKNLTPQQRKMQALIGKLDGLRADLERDNPKPKWTPERRVHFRGENPTKNVRPLDLAKQIRDEIAKYEKERPEFSSH